ncbi:MAG: SdiA-regulated domain-containing protein, partial [Anaerolineae bacterium]
MRNRNRNQTGNLLLSTRLVAVVVLILVILVAGSSLAQAQENQASVRQVQAIESGELGLAHPAGVAYSPGADALLVVDAPELGGRSALFPGITFITPLEGRVGTAHLLVERVDPLNMAFDGRASRLLLYQAATRELIEVGAGPDGYLNPAMVTRRDAREFGLERPQGMAVDPASGQVYFLDSAGPRIVSVDLDLQGKFSEVVVRQVDLDETGLRDLRGLAFDPTTGHLFVLAPVEQMLYELSLTGEVVASRDLSPFVLQNPQGMVFAPSGDSTDDPSKMSLYIADSGLNAGLEGQTTSQSSGEIVELSFDEIEPQAETIAATLVQVIDTSLFDPPSPDPAGITYLESPGRLLVSDSEVNEMDPPIWQGSNLFEISLDGILESTSTTTGFSNEPTGVAYDPAGNGRVFISDDDTTEIYIVDLGPDGEYDPGDARTQFDTLQLYGGGDPEGVAYDTWDDVLFIVDDVNNEVYRVDPGAGGVFGDGNDTWTSWDTLYFEAVPPAQPDGVASPEGIAFDPENGHLYIVGNTPNDRVAHVTTSGDLVRWIDTSAADSRRPAGLTCAPGSQDPSAMNIYMTDRGTDNNDDPTENDGKVYELYVPAIEPDVT